MVEARHGGGAKYYPGKIARDNRDGTYDVDYNDGDKENNVPASRIKCASPSDKPCGGAKSSGSAVADHMEDAEGLEPHGDAEADHMVFKGNGCCRFNGWKATNKGYMSEAACKSTCLASDNCAAADVDSNGVGGATQCFHFVGDAAHSSFKEQCDTQDLTQKCFRKEKAAAPVHTYDESRTGYNGAMTGKNTDLKTRVLQLVGTIEQQVNNEKERLAMLASGKKRQKDREGSSSTVR